MRSLALLLALAAVAGCLAPSTSTNTTSTTTAPPAVPEEPTSLQFLSRGNESAAQGIWVEDNLAYLSGPAGLRVVDIQDPLAPVLVAKDVPDTASRDVALMHHPNGRLYAVLAAGVVKLVDVTDLATAGVVSQGTLCTHNIAVVPNSTVVYSSWSLCQATVPDMVTSGDLEIIDFADPLNPVSMYYAFPPVAMTVGGTPRPVTATSCHDVTFNAALKRAYCAGVTDTLIWDVSDPLHPTILQVVDWPGTNIHHAAWDARNGTILILGDEFAGVAAPSPPCSSTFRDPTSALWFFDISDLANPTPMGYFQIEYDQISPENPGTWPYCSTHFGDVLQDRDLLVMGWYAAGVVLVDFSDPANAKQVAAYHPEGATNTWEARFYGDLVLTGDTIRGMDILRVA